MMSRENQFCHRTSGLMYFKLLSTPADVALTRITWSLLGAFAVSWSVVGGAGRKWTACSLVEL